MFRKRPTPQPEANEDIQKLKAEQERLQAEANKIFIAKVERVQKQIQDLLNKEGLTLEIDHIVKIVPKQR